MSKKPMAEPGEFGKYVDMSKPVKVYKNLARGCYSIQQGGIVRCHAKRLGMYDCQLRVSEAGRQRVLRDKRKNVHAFVVGKLSSLVRSSSYSTTLRYNPYESGSFIASNQYHTGPVTKAFCVELTSAGATCIL